jgi:hypothetical protein
VSVENNAIAELLCQASPEMIEQLLNGSIPDPRFRLFKRRAEPHVKPVRRRFPGDDFADLAAPGSILPHCSLHRLNTSANPAL